MKQNFSVILAAFALAVQLHADKLEKGFQSPPDSAKPHTWWHWMNGNVTKSGITADLEAMARVGIGGAQIFNAAEGIPHGPIQFNSPEWRELVKFAAQEAGRLGLELCIHNCAGWSSSGGPWNTPEHGMQVIVTSETKVKGPAKFDAKLPQPPTKLDCYRDIAVLAWRTPVAELVTMRQCNPKVTTSARRGDAATLIDGKDGPANVGFDLPTPQKPQFIQLEFAQPFTARTLTLKSAYGMRGCNGQLKVSDDGISFRAVESFQLPKDSNEPRVFTFLPVTARYFRALFLGANSKNTELAISKIELSPRLGVEGFPAKAFYDRGTSEANSMTATDAIPDEVVAGERVVDLSTKMEKNGHLVWDAPEGDWTVVRFGYTPNGRNNHPAPKEGTGLECDKLSREAVEAHWAGALTPLLKELGPLAGKGKPFNNVLIDSYEVGSQNWTPEFREEFRKRCGYDLIPFLPALAGRVVDSPQITERFLWDFRRVIADLFAENYSGVFAELAHKNGLLYSVEPYGNCPSDDMQYGSYADIPMTEFWPGAGGGGKMAAAIAHVHGLKYVGAESFTAAPEMGKWLKDPFALKPAGDAAWCNGINRFILHCYAHQPWTSPTQLPGMTMGQWGTHFGRTSTWWEQSRAWMQYLARSQYLLQQGLFVADVCFFAGDGAPNALKGSLPPGYDFDGICAADLKLLSVKDGRIVLPDGMSYRMLALPNDVAMTPASLRKIKQLADAGALVVGPKPMRSPGLANFPKCDNEVAQLAAAAKIVTDKTPAEILAALNVPPDFEVVGAIGQADYIHRVVGNTEVYFVSSQRERSAEMECTFRVSGKTPELWHPDTGRIEVAPVWREEKGRTIVPLKFDPAGSVFVVFRKPAAADHIVSAQFTAAGLTAQAAPAELTILKAEYGVFPAVVSTPAQNVDVTAKVAAQVKAGRLTIRSGNELADGDDPAGGIVKELRLEYRAAGSLQNVVVTEGKTVQLPAGAEIVHATYGIFGEEKQPEKVQKADITSRVAAQVKNGRLAVKANYELAGCDPAPMLVKELIVEYRHRGIVQTTRVAENAMFELPEGETITAPLAYELTVNAAGQAALCAWQPGDIEVKTATGKTLKAAVRDLPKPRELSGDWTLNFLPNWGAPASVSLPQLISWTEHADNGVKYFSGTATYVKEVEISAAQLGSRRSLWLDLGVVKNIAEVFVNGKPLGILWKPPFRVDISGAAKPGKNKLEIKITNLWPNRLIGDEQLPEDRRWGNNLALKEWPQWLLDGKPSPTGRLTFTTWHHWKKDDKLLPSGLLGPVTIQMTQKCKITP